MITSAPALALPASPAAWRDGAGGRALALAALVLASSAAAQRIDPPPGASSVQAAAEAPPTGARRSRFVDPDDGQLDLSEFLASARGFLPVPIIVTEPAVGYGAGGAALFLRPRREAGAEGWSRPDLSAVGALATENGTWAGFAGDSSNWLDGRLRTLVGLARGDIHLDFYRPTVGDPDARRPVAYALDVAGGLAQADWRVVADADWWLGLRYAYAEVDASLRREPPVPVPDDAGRVTISAPTLLLTFDARDNLFTPTRGLYAGSSLLVSREAIGSDGDYERFDQIAMGWLPLGRDGTLGLRGDYGWTSDGTPFFLLPFVMLRGVPAMRYAGQQMASAEAELRWRVRDRWSLVAFGGIGAVRIDRERIDYRDEVVAAGAGFRYEIARRFGLHVGLDVARSPDTTAFYIIVGNAWFRP